MDLEQIWQNTLGEMEIQLSRANFATWLKNSRLVDKKDGTFYISLPNNFAKEWVANKYNKNILGILRNMDGSAKKLEFLVESRLQQPWVQAKGHATPAVLEEGLDVELRVDPETNLNPKYALKSFVVGPSNELAYAAATAIVEAVGVKYNPFFIYGGVGLGKTHLIQAIGNEIMSKHNGKSTRYVPSEKFTNDVIWGIKNNRMESTKKKYRDVDVLIIDDIQFIGGKEKTEEEFFHTFNALYETNKQIIISSDRPPQSIPTLEERLRSRFEGGLIADIGYPEYETRVAILKSKLNELGRELNDPVVDLIAKKIKKNVRELEGILKKILFYAEEKRMEITEKLAAEIIEKSLQNIPKKVTDAQILKVVAEEFGVTIENLISHNRRKEFVLPRQVAMYLLRDILELSYPYIGEKMGRDHTTAIHSYEKINQETNRNPGINNRILTIRENIFKS